MSRVVRGAVVGLTAYVERLRANHDAIVSRSMIARVSRDTESSLASTPTQGARVGSKDNQAAPFIGCHFTRATDVPLESLTGHASALVQVYALLPRPAFDFGSLVLVANGEWWKP